MPAQKLCLHLLLFTLVFGPLSGCQYWTERVAANALRGDKSVNAFVDEGARGRVRRVLVMRPLQQGGQHDIREMLYRNLLLELDRKQFFEVLREEEFPPSFIVSLTTSPSSASVQKPPMEAMRMASESYGLDAVLYPEVRQYRGFKPLMFRYKHVLIDTASREVAWLVDDAFDMTDRMVERMAKTWYFKNHGEEANPSLQGDMVHLSFENFLRFSMFHLLDSWAAPVA